MIVVIVVVVVVVVVRSFWCTELPNAPVTSGVATTALSQDISLFQKILASMNLLSPADMLREVQGFVSSTEVPREKLNCTEFLKAWPESDVFYKQLTFQGKMAAANVVKDIAVNLELGYKQTVSVPDTQSFWNCLL